MEQSFGDRFSSLVALLTAGQKSSAVMYAGGSSKLAGTCLLVQSLQRRRRRVDFVLRRSDGYDDGTQLQQELFTLKAEVIAESGLADALRAANNLVNAQAQRDTPNLIDV